MSVLPPDFILDLEDKIKALPRLRKKIGMSQQAVADMIGIAQSAYSALENRKMDLSYNRLVRLVRLIDYWQFQLLGILPLDRAYTDALYRQALPNQAPTLEKLMSHIHHLERENKALKLQLDKCSNA